MIVNPIYIDENSGSNGSENDWDPRNMKEDVMLDLSNYTAQTIGTSGFFFDASGNNEVTYNGKSLIFITSGNTSPILIDDSNYYSGSTSNNYLKYVGIIPGSSGCYKIKLKSTASGHRLRLDIKSDYEYIKGVYQEN